MTGHDRTVRRASQHLAEGEVLIASAAGREHDGRRRGAVLVTDRRVLVAWQRGGPATELDLDATAAHRDEPGHLLTVGDGEHELVLRDVEPRSADQLVALLTDRRPRPSEPYIARPRRVRILDV